MAVTSGLFGKASLDPGAVTPIWTNTSANAATLNVIYCNKGNIDTLIRLAIVPRTNIGGPADDKDYIAWDQPLPVASMFEFTGIVVSPLESVYCYARDVDVSVRVHGFVDDRGPGVSDIGYATVNNAGIVQFSQGLDVVSTDRAATPAQVKALIDAYAYNGGGGSGGGTGGAGGLSSSLHARYTQVLTSPLSTTQEFGGIPSYLVGAGNLQVFLNGILASCGNDKDKDAYQELGVEGAYSDRIKFFDAYPVGTEITVIV